MLSNIVMINIQNKTRIENLLEPDTEKELQLKLGVIVKLQRLKELVMEDLFLLMELEDLTK